MRREQSSQSRWERIRSEAFRAPWLSAVQERELLGRAQRGDRAAMEALCESHLRLVVQIAGRYQRPWVQPEDLVGEGLSQRFGRAPTHAEIAAELNVSEADVTSVAVAYAVRNTSLSDTDNLEFLEPSEPGPGPEEELAAHEEEKMRVARLSSSLASLGDRDRMIIDAHFIREDATMSDLGDALGISRQRVSQIVHRLRKTLQKDLSCVAC